MRGDPLERQRFSSCSSSEGSRSSISDSQTGAYRARRSCPSAPPLEAAKVKKEGLETAEGERTGLPMEPITTKAVNYRGSSLPSEMRLEIKSYICEQTWAVGKMLGLLKREFTLDWISKLVVYMP